jgi:hypothetical protein
MRFNALLIVSLLTIVIAAPIVDAIACDECGDIVPIRNKQRPTITAGQSDHNVLSSEARGPVQQDTATPPDLCPVCANIAATMDNSCCGAPFMMSQANHLPKLIALSDPSYSITKPPQN